VSRYDLFRRRVAPIAFGVAIVLLARESCQKNERVHAMIHLDLGAAEAKVTAVDATVLDGTETLGQFHREALPGVGIGPCQFQVALPHEDGDLKIGVDLGTDHRDIRRHIHIVEGSQVTVPLAPDLE
jgi:hypothetical protein